VTKEALFKPVFRLVQCVGTQGALKDAEQALLICFTGYAGDWGIIGP
jgi:hypothetical protein